MPLEGKGQSGMPCLAHVARSAAGKGLPGSQSVVESASDERSRNSIVRDSNGVLLAGLCLSLMACGSMARPLEGVAAETSPLPAGAS